MLLGPPSSAELAESHEADRTAVVSILSPPCQDPTSTTSMFCFQGEESTVHICTVEAEDYGTE